MQSAFLILSLALFVLTGPILALLAAPVGDGPVLVIAPGAAQRDAIVHHAGGHVIGPLRGVLGTLAISESSDFPQQLRANGAWFVGDGRKVAALCGVQL